MYSFFRSVKHIFSTKKYCFILTLKLRVLEKKKAVYYLLLYNRQTKMTLWPNDHRAPWGVHSREGRAKLSKLIPILDVVKEKRNPRVRKKRQVLWNDSDHLTQTQDYIKSISGMRWFRHWKGAIKNLWPKPVNIHLEGIRCWNRAWYTADP